MPYRPELLSTLPGIGEKTSEKLAVRGFLTIQDLWFHLPRDYEDRTRITRISELQLGVAGQFEGVVVTVERGFRYRPVLQVVIDDGSPKMLTLRFFHFRVAQALQFARGKSVRCYGVPRVGHHGLEMVHPSYQVLSNKAHLEEQLTPVYPVISGVSTSALRRWIGLALDQLPKDDYLELLPSELLSSLELPSLRDALLLVHKPLGGNDVSALLSGSHPAQCRLALEELFAHHLSLRRQRMMRQQHRTLVLTGTGQLATQLRHSLPFQLTQAQERVFAQMQHDFCRSFPMLRLMQGDVGSGKTVVAALVAALFVEQGKQVALMAPTDLLVEQHLTNFQSWFSPFGIRIIALAGNVSGKAREKVLADIASGAGQIIVGTHALMQKSVEFHDLALTIIDEQHRFGVRQRLALRDKCSGKGEAERVIPHQLIMTATPIPRTMAMVAYADVDVSTIDELPPGRFPVRTFVLNATRRPELISRIRTVCTKGRQAYWVCTLIDDSDELIAQAAQSTFDLLSESLPELRIGLVHGRMKSSQKQAAMHAFKDAQIDLLVATTVIEVGVDVPDASLMIIENAERLGLAQLHQLRGRVGRGSTASSCVLLYQSPLSMQARKRLQTMRDTNDGFVIAEKDLNLRGPGEVLGTRQTGAVTFRVANLARDGYLLPHICRFSDHLLMASPNIADQLINRWIGGSIRYASA